MLKQHSYGINFMILRSPMGAIAIVQQVRTGGKRQDVARYTTLKRGRIVSLADRVDASPSDNAVEPLARHPAPIAQRHKDALRLADARNGDRA